MYKNKVLSYFLAVMTIAIVNFGQATACTDVLLNNSADYIISGRNFDFDFPLRSELVIVPEGQQREIMLANSLKGISWESKYGFVGINMLGKDDFLDGMNEQGLSAALLTFQSAKYQKTEAYPRYNEIPVNYAVEWMLGNFASVKEVRQALSHTIITEGAIKQLDKQLLMNIVVHDKTGASIVVEFIDGKMRIFDNSAIKVVANEPTYDWQQDNLKKYQQYTNLMDAGKLVKNPEEDSGMPKLPGNSTSAARFARAYLLNKFTANSGTARIAVNRLLPIMERVKILLGEAQTDTSLTGKPNFTLWTAVRDHTNLIFYYKDITNQNLRAVELKNLDLRKTAPIRRSVMEANGEWYTPIMGNAITI